MSERDIEKKTKPEILYSGFLDPQHSQCGGYDKLLNIDIPHDVLLLENVPWGYLPMSSRMIRLPLFFLDMRTRFRRYGYRITHFFYGDVTLFYPLPLLKSLFRKRGKTVVTLHLDVEKRPLRSFFIRCLRGFDAVIVLSRQQKEILREKYGIESHFIPHGFNPPEFECRLPLNIKGEGIDRGKINLITVGRMYRDFRKLYNMVVRYVDNPDYHFHLVGAPGEVKDIFRKFENVSIYNFLPDNEFYTLIEACDYCFLPLRFATANNTLLEAQNLGVPLVVSDIPGVRDYAMPSSPNRFFANEEELKNILDKIEKRPQKSEELKEYAKKFAWKNIYPQIKKVYDTIMNQNKS